jgi:predicted PurR-regulated permease PerM
MTDLQRVMTLILIVILAVLVYLLKPILTPFLVGALLAYLGDPIADKLEEKGLSRTLAVCVVFTVLLMVSVGLLIITIPLIGQQLDLLTQKLPQWFNAFQQTVVPWLQQRFELEEGSLPVAKVKQVISENWLSAGDLLTNIWQRVTGSGMALLAGVANLVLIPVVAFYLLRDWDVLMAHLRDLLPRNWEQKTVLVSQECDEIISAFLRGQLMVMLALGIIYSIGLSFVGLDMALLLGLLAGLAAIVPYMGFIIGIAAAGVAAWFQFHDPMMLVWVAVVFGIGQVLESMLLTPILVGDRIGLHPVAVIFAVMAGGQLAGFTGVLLGLPVAAVVMVVLRHLHHSYKNSELYSTP